MNQGSSTSNETNLQTIKAIQEANQSTSQNNRVQPENSASSLSASASASPSNDLQELTSQYNRMKQPNAQEYSASSPSASQSTSPLGNNSASQTTSAVGQSSPPQVEPGSRSAYLSSSTPPQVETGSRSASLSSSSSASASASSLTPQELINIYEKPDVSQEELYQVCSELSSFNTAALICKQSTQMYDKSCSTKPIWNDGVSPVSLYNAIIQEEYTDPRDQLLETCLFIGKANKDTKEYKLMSYCLGAKCEIKVCFDIDELKNHLSNPKSKNEKGEYVNPWYAELTDKTSTLPEDVKASVSNTMQEDWVLAIQCQLAAIQEKKELLSGPDQALYSIVANGLAHYFMRMPWAMTVGSFFSSIPGTTTVMSWVKPIVSNVGSVLNYIAKNVFASQLCLLISKVIKFSFCLWLSLEADIKDFLTGEYLKQQITAYFRNYPLVRMVLQAMSIVTQCAVSTLIGNWNPLAWLACIHTVFSSIQNASKILKYVMNAVFSVLQHFLSYFTGESFAFLKSFSGYASWSKVFPTAPPTGMAYMLLTDSLIKYVDADLTYVLFWSMLSIIPMDNVSGFLVLIVEFCSKNMYINKAVDCLLDIIEKLKDKRRELNLAQLVLYAMKYSANPLYIYKSFMEVYYWIFYLGACRIQKETNYLRTQLFTFGIIPRPVGMLEATGTACCLKALVGDLSTLAVNPIKGGNKSHDHSHVRLTDLRLKHLLLNVPVFSIMFMNKPVHFYLYRWNIEQGKNFGFHFNNNVHIGLVAQDFEKHFPELVVQQENGLVDIVNLPCELQQVLAGLNGTQLPKCQTRFKRFKLTQDGRL